MSKLLWTIFILQIVFVIGSPVPADQEVDDLNPPTRRPRLISFDNGRVGVNFLGYKASAGLGGLLTGNSADGGLHAEAETPFGQKAGAGLGGLIDALGNRSGFKYSYADSG